jgi:hypothetical protein
MRGRVGAIQTDAHDDDDNGNKARNQERDMGVLQGLPRREVIFQAE